MDDQRRYSLFGRGLIIVAPCGGQYRVKLMITQRSLLNRPPSNILNKAMWLFILTRKHRFRILRSTALLWLTDIGTHFC